MENKLNIWKIDLHYPWYKSYKSLFSKIKWSYQRIKYGFCDCDVWNLDCTLGNYIASTVNKLKETTHGYPADITEKEWDKILSELSKDFYLASNEDTWHNPYEAMIYCSEKDDDVFKKYAEKEFDNHKMREERLDNGCNLLKKWFFDLWD